MGKNMARKRCHLKRRPVTDMGQKLRPVKEGEEKKTAQSRCKLDHVGGVGSFGKTFRYNKHT